MKTIKFRGQTIRKNTLVTGDLKVGRTFEGEILYCKIITFPSQEKNAMEYQIKKDSIAQFIGVDKNGLEVYEGDVLIDELEQEHVAEIYDRPQFIKTMILKQVPIGEPTKPSLI